MGAYKYGVTPSSRKANSTFVFDIDGKATAVELRPDDRRQEMKSSKGETFKLNPGGYDVFVSGKLWGRFMPESLGPRGALYYLGQVGERGIANKCFVVRTSGKYGQTVYFTAPSDASYRPEPGTPFKPLDARLIDVVADAIKQGALRNPATLAAEVKAAKDRAAVRIQAEEAEMEAKAREAIGPYAHGLAKPVVADLTTRIVAAMKWAQLR